MLSNAFYALQETAAPAKAALWALGLNLVLCAALMFPLKISGVALASTLSGGYSTWYLYKMLKRRIGALDLAETRELFFKTCLLGLVLGLAARGIWLAGAGHRYIAFTAICLVDTALFIAGLRLFRFKQAAALKEFFKG